MGSQNYPIDKGSLAPVLPYQHGAIFLQMDLIIFYNIHKDILKTNIMKW